MTDQKKLETRADRGAGTPPPSRQVDWFEVGR